MHSLPSLTAICPFTCKMLHYIFFLCVFMMTTPSPSVASSSRFSFSLSCLSFSQTHLVLTLAIAPCCSRNYPNYLYSHTCPPNPASCCHFYVYAHRFLPINHHQMCYLTTSTCSVFLRPLPWVHKFSCDPFQASPFVEFPCVDSYGPASSLHLGLHGQRFPKALP